MHEEIEAAKFCLVRRSIAADETLVESESGIHPLLETLDEILTTAVEKEHQQ